MPGCYFSPGKNRVLVRAATWMDLGSVMGSKKPNTKVHVLYDPICMKGADWEIYRDRKYMGGGREQSKTERGVSASVGFPLEGVKRFATR